MSPNLHLCNECKSRESELKLPQRSFNQFIIDEAKDNQKCQGCKRFHIAIDRLKLVGPFIAVKPIKQELFYRNKIILPATLTFWRIWCIANVEALGEKKVYFCKYINKKGDKMGKTRTFGHPEVSVGESVLVETQSMRRCSLGGDVVFLVHYADVVAIIEDINSFYIC